MPASTASTTTPGPITAASSRRRSPCAESATRALFAWPNNGESRPAREHCNQQIGCCSLPGVLLYVLLLHCCTAVLGRVVGAWWVVGGWWAATRPLPEMAEYLQKRNSPPVCFLFHTRSSRTNQLTAPRVPGVLLYVLLHCCSAVCSKGLVGGWVECTVRRPWCVGRSVRGSLFASCGG